MNSKKHLIIFLATVQTCSLYPNAWATLNHGFARLNFRASRAPAELIEDENDKSNFLGGMMNCSEYVNAGKLLSWGDVRILKNFITKYKQHKQRDYALRILNRHRLNVFNAAREVKCTIIALLTSYILYKNRTIVGKKWEQLKDVLSGMAITWLCYRFRHQLTNGLSAVLGSLRGASSKNSDDW